MHILKEEFNLDLRQAHYACHADNASKELKNNCCLQILSGLVSLHRLKAASANFLQSGHSHDDLDQSFSSLAQHIASRNEIHTTDDYVLCIQEWLDKPSTRPTERFKKVFRVDENRSWKLGGC